MVDKNLFNVDLDQDDITIDPEKDYLEELVGEGKKFPTIKELARGKLESDLHIKRLEKENKEHRSQLATSKNLADLIDQLRLEREKRDAISNQQEPPVGEDAVKNVNITQEAIEELFEKAFAKRENQNSRAKNVDLVLRQAQEALGPGFSQVLAQRREALGLGEEFANELAQTQPQAFIKLFEIEQKAPSGGTNLFTKSDINTTGKANPSNVKDYKYFQKMRREKGQDWFDSVETQKEMYRSITELGEETFYA